MHKLKPFNISRWSNEPDFFEIWYYTFNDLSSKNSFWIRLTLVVPKNVLDTPYLNLWFTAFLKDGEIVSSISENFKVSDCKFLEDKIIVGRSFISEESIEGEIYTPKEDKKIYWSLKISGGSEFLHLPSFIYNLPLLHSYVASPNLSFEINGEIGISDQKFEIKGKGTQSHIWGRMMPDSWVWAHSDNFEHHNGCMEILSAHTNLPILNQVSMTRLFLEFEDEKFNFLTFNGIRFKEYTIFPEYLFFAAGEKYKIEGKLYADRKRFAQYHYPMPSNKEVYCANTEVGSLNIVVYKRDGILKPFHYYTVLKNEGLTHYEFGSGGIIQDIPLLNKD